MALSLGQCIPSSQPPECKGPYTVAPRAGERVLGLAEGFCGLAWVPVHRQAFHTLAAPQKPSPGRTAEPSTEVPENVVPKMGVSQRAGPGLSAFKGLPAQCGSGLSPSPTLEPCPQVGAIGRVGALREGVPGGVPLRGSGVFCVLGMTDVSS